MAAKRLWLARHAAPLVAPGTCYGATDLAADAAHTLECAQRLAAALPSGMVVRFSTLQRCEQLAQALQALRPDLGFNPEPRLVEMDFGAWEGRPWDQVAREEFAAWMADFPRHRPGGGEAVQSFLDRIARVWDEDKAAAQDTAWIAHAGVIRAAVLLQAGLRRIERADQWPREGPAFGEWVVLPL